MSHVDLDVDPDEPGICPGGETFEEMDLELAFLRCLPLAPPFGRHKHFRIIALQSMIHEVTGFLIPFPEIWSRLSGMYDLSEMDELASTAAELPSSPKVLSPQLGPFRPNIDWASSSSAAEDDLEEQSSLSSPRSPSRLASASPSLSPPPPTPRKGKQEVPDITAAGDNSSRRSKRKASISTVDPEPSRKRGRPRAGSNVGRGRSVSLRYKSRSPSRSSVSPATPGLPAVTKLQPTPKGRSQRDATSLHPLNSPSQTPFSPVPMPGTTWLWPAVFPYPVLPPSMMETQQYKEGKTSGRSRKQEFKKGERTSPRPPSMDDLQYSSRIYELNSLNPHVHHGQPTGDKARDQPEQSILGSGSKSADCLNSRHFEREFALPLFESYIARAEMLDEPESGLEAMVGTLAGEETQKWYELAYARVGKGARRPDRENASDSYSKETPRRASDTTENRVVSFTTTHREAQAVEEELGLVDPDTSSEMTAEDTRPTRRRGR
ncbi:hypothetical protein NliqN6_3133 [Naganishia liquefaciens]|uniref:Uncharacterized protein n=1 Tax=Naganishia liquefaciens TaxID=104408 RepID=A0A8H3TSP1_9TREE|nr:hypothetical protein NliqN6_3133 [Naganishia liquefaciens]